MKRNKNPAREKDAAVKIKANSPAQSASRSIEGFGTRKLILVIFALLASATFLAYSNSFQGVFVFDDGPCIVDNPTIRSFEASATATLDEIPLGLKRRDFVRWSLALNYYFGQLDPFGYHVVNLVVHIINGWLIFLLASSLLRRKKIGSDEQRLLLPFAISLIWLLHPIQTESVTYVVQRLESIASLFYLIVFYSFVRGVKSENRIWFGVAILSMLLGVYSKEIIFTAPFLLIVFDRVFLSASWPELWTKRKWIHAVLVACTILIFLSIKLNSGSIERVPYVDLSPQPGANRWEYLRSQPPVVLHYIRSLFVPTHLCLDYLWPISIDRTEIFISGALILALVTTSVVFCFRNSPFGFLLFSFFFILAPTSTLQPLLLAFDHRIYLAMVSLIAMVVLSLFQAMGMLAKASGTSEKIWSRTAFTLLIAVAFVCGYLTYQRNFVYHSRLAMWEDVAAKAPWNARAFCNIAVIKMEQKDFDFEEVESLMQHSLQLRPNYIGGWQNLGALYLNAGKYENALESFLIGFEKSKQRSFDICSRIGYVHLKLGNVDKSIEYHKKAIEIYPRFIKSHLELARIFGGKGKIRLAESHYEKILEIQPDNVTSLVEWAKLKMIMGQIQSAQILVTNAVELSPDNPSLRFVRGAVYQSTNLAIAKLEYERSIAIDPRFGQGYVALADLAFQKKEFAESRRWIARAMEAGNHSEFVLVELLSLSIQLKDGRLKKLVAEKLLNINPNNAAALKALQ